MKSLGARPPLGPPGSYDLVEDEYIIDLQSKSVDWFLYDKELRHERVKETKQKLTQKTETYSEPCQISNMKHFAKIVTIF